MELNTSFSGLANYFFNDHLLEAEILSKAIQIAHQEKMTLTHYLVRSNILDSQTILNYCVKRFELPLFDLTHYDPTWLQDPDIKPEFIERYRVIPLHRNQDYLSLGLTDPTNHAAIAAAEFHTGLRIRPMLVSESELSKIIDTHFRHNGLHAQLESTLSKITPAEESLSTQEIAGQNEEPVIELVDRLIKDAVEKEASDIHIEPYELNCRIRFRCDGLLYEAATIPTHLATRISTRLKIMAHLNIAERRLPQDGRIQLHYPAKLKKNNRLISKIDMRINTCPTLFGEKMVLRLLDTSHQALSMDMLGLNESQKKLFLTKLTEPQGLILVTGPTGSGKTVTLYSALHYLNQIEKNISSAEDPIEMELYGINQVNINPRIGLDFATTLRTFLRQDPDVIMIGEIRDTDTATIAMQAAQTGHLVLSTLHTNSAVESIVRLQSMGVAPYNLIDSISLIMAQRLVRQLCSFCKQAESFTPIHQATTYQAIGCEHCHQGYKGRIGIFELIPLTETLAHLILSQAPASQMLSHIKQEGGLLLWEAGLEKVKTGITSTAEILRITGS